MKVTLNSFSRTISMALLASSLSFVVACDKDDDKDDKNTSPVVVAPASTGTPGQTTTETTPADTTAKPAEGTTLTEAADCEAQWKAYVKQNPAGLELAYKTTSVTKGNDGVAIATTESNYSSKVTASSDVEVTTVMTFELGAGLPSSEQESTQTKVAFLETCATAEGEEVDATFTILEEKAEKITVPAGTFDTQYMKIQLAAEAGGAISTSWVMADGSSFLVKSESTAEIPGFGSTVSTVELTKIVRP